MWYSLVFSQLWNELENHVQELTGQELSNAEMNSCWETISAAFVDEELDDGKDALICQSVCGWWNIGKSSWIITFQGILLFSLDIRGFFKSSVEYIVNHILQLICFWVVISKKKSVQHFGFSSA